MLLSLPSLPLATLARAHDDLPSPKSRLPQLRVVLEQVFDLLLSEKQPALAKSNLDHPLSPPGSKGSTSTASACRRSGSDTARECSPCPPARYADSSPRGSEDRRPVVAAAWSMHLLRRDPAEDPISRPGRVAGGAYSATHDADPETTPAAPRTGSTRLVNLAHLSGTTPPAGVVEPCSRERVAPEVERVRSCEHGRRERPQEFEKRGLVLANRRAEVVRERASHPQGVALNGDTAPGLRKRG